MLDEHTWCEIEAELQSRDVPIAVMACERLHAAALIEDAPRLLELLKHPNFFVREAAAWPLAELLGPQVIAELLAAYQRGFDEGLDNDGFTAALLEIPELHAETRAALTNLIPRAEGSIKAHALWLLEFCD
ncbi:MAG: hypothetical protein KF871_03730 [Hydrogenophaga sp.]|uniref:hypothetical protein n=1 Tax=Hydrogenophaga sp. TaxID=1904254 RepID=UPI001D61EB86|nr:hypothetical protein [Hydrogenophaga sp.]MBX3608982.1 hypothetical protein [Hydrogenophaga sp.]